MSSPYYRWVQYKHSGNRLFLRFIRQLTVWYCCPCSGFWEYGPALQEGE